jgi:uncharacterized protein
MYIDSPITNTGENSQGVFQEALDAIEADQLAVAHRFLLKALKADPQNIQIWLLLGWTAPTSASAAFYFQRLLEQHPNNPLARDMLKRVSDKSDGEGIRSELDISGTKKVISKTISNSGESEVENQAVVRKTKLVASQAAVSKIKPIEVQTASKKASWISIPKSMYIPLAYLAALTLAEALTTLAIPQIGLILHGLLLVMLILHATLFARRGLQKFLITLTLAPLIRLMSLSLPLLNFPFIYWYALIGIPLMLAAFLVLRTTGFKADRIGLNMHKLPWQLVVGLTGLVLGFMEYIILRPNPLVEALTWQQILLPSLILLVFTGFLEELIFRGLIQRGAAGTVGHFGLLYVAILFAVLHLGYHSILDLIFVFVVALFFGLVVTRTGSLLGVTLSHGLTNITLYLIIPFLMNASANPIATIPQTGTDSTSIPLAWLVPDSNTKLMTLDNGDTGISHMNTQWGLFEVKVGARPNWVYMENRGATINEKSQQGYMDYGICRVQGYPPKMLAISKLACSPIWYRMVTIE